MTKIVTRFAPSPTGDLHIGSARTALFNWLFARRHGGDFLIRIEDTDKARSDDKYTHSILRDLKWLGIDWKYEPEYQSNNINEHQAVAQRLVKYEKAYKSDGVIRLRSLQDGIMTINDIVQGQVTVKNSQMDDMVLLRSDGTPTYMLACVVDDYDMGITHVIRGDDHLNNAFRQMRIYNAMGWKAPQFAHIPLIHTVKGNKMSKRAGESGLKTYKDMGIPSAAMLNYLLRLGWSHGDKEIFSKNEAIDLFNLESIGKSPAKFNDGNFLALSSRYIHKIMEDDELLWAMLPFVKDALSDSQINRLKAALPDLRTRSKNLIDLAESGKFYCNPQPLNEKAKELLTIEGRDRLLKAKYALESLSVWNRLMVKDRLKTAAGDELGKYMHVLRAALTGKTVSPGVFEILVVLGKDESLNRIDKVLNEYEKPITKSS